MADKKDTTYVVDVTWLRESWDYKRNFPILPSEVKVNSHKIFSWICTKDPRHTWDQSPHARYQHHSGCPICANKRIVAGINDLETLRPDIASEWHPTLNGTLRPFQVAVRSNKKVWWQCKTGLPGHEWEETVDKRASGRGCPFCSNRRVLPGYNDLATKEPKLAKEWDDDKNGDLKPEDFVYGSTKKVHWKCATCSFEWVATIRDRRKGHGCWQCSEKQKQQSRLATYRKKNGTAAELPFIEEWYQEKNGDKTPEDYTPRSNQKVWWKCQKCGHEWEATIGNRANGRGCPCCANKVIVPGINDLATTHPDLANEWHPTNNGELKPTEVFAGSARKVWWQCPRGHSYKASLLHRSQGTECSVCNSGRQTSFAEQAVFFYVKQICPDAENRVLGLLSDRMELDVYIPSRRLAIEYDGSFWHKEDKLERDIAKFEQCKRHGIHLIRIKEKRIAGDEQSADEILCAEKLESGKNLDVLIQVLVDRLDPESNMWTRRDPGQIHSRISIDLERDRMPIRSSFVKVLKNNLLLTNPELAMEWHPTKNGSLTPEQVSRGSNLRAWWLCSKCGYEWQAPVYRRSQGSGCSQCYRRLQKIYHPEAKPILQLTEEGILVREWRSLSEAARNLKINSSNISTCARGQRSKAGGYVWRYKE